MPRYNFGAFFLPGFKKDYTMRCMDSIKKMRILAIETSCDETAISIVEASGGNTGTLNILSDLVVSQIDLHREYGGVFPMLAKREHAKNLVPILKQAIKKAEENGLNITENKFPISNFQFQKIFEREPELLEAFLKDVPNLGIPEIDAIAFTRGPGLPPALWVGVNFAVALSLAWNKPLIPVNHMEGHLFSACLSGKENPKLKFQNPKTPTLALLISGGHTQIVLSEEHLKYKIIGETRDDAVGEAFDKVARILGLPYPGGPEISKRAEKFRTSGKTATGKYKLPRPMIKSGDLDFSFSGIKTSALYTVQKIEEMTEDIREEICYEFEEAVTETLLSKMSAAAEQYNPRTMILGGGVSCNTYIQKKFKEEFSKNFPETEVMIPKRELSTDNSVMIALAGYLRANDDQKNILPPGTPQVADGNLSL